MTYEDFLDKYEPVKNNIDPNAAFDGYMFETYGNELTMLHAQPDNHIWTIIEGDNGLYLASGYHSVNRIGYFITLNPWEDENIEINLED